MADLWRFVIAVGRHWHLLVSGAFIITAIGVVKRLVRTKLSTRLHISLLIVLFFVASFLAWRDEHRKADELERKISDERYPQFDVSIQQITVGTMEVTLRAGEQPQSITYTSPVVLVVNTGLNP